MLYRNIINDIRLSYRDNAICPLFPPLNHQGNTIVYFIQVVFLVCSKFSRGYYNHNSVIYVQLFVRILYKCIHFSDYIPNFRIDFSGYLPIFPPRCGQHLPPYFLHDFCMQFPIFLTPKPTEGTHILCS